MDFVAASLARQCLLVTLWLLTVLVVGCWWAAAVSFWQQAFSWSGAGTAPSRGAQSVVLLFAKAGMDTPLQLHLRVNASAVVALEAGSTSGRVQLRVNHTE